MFSKLTGDPKKGVLPQVRILFYFIFLSFFVFVLIPILQFISLLHPIYHFPHLTFQPITLENGTTVRPEEVMGDPIPGRKFVVLGDTSNSDAVAAAGINFIYLFTLFIHSFISSFPVKGCTAVVHETTFDETREEEAIAKGHSTTKMAALFADQIDAEVLIMNHFSARYTPEDTQVRRGRKRGEMRIVLFYFLGV